MAGGGEMRETARRCYGISRLKLKEGKAVGWLGDGGGSLAHREMAGNGGSAAEFLRR